MTKFSPMAKSLSAYIPSAFLTKKKRRCHQIQSTFKLNPDLLYVIFMACLQLEQRFNVSSLGHRTADLISPLLTACRISQVCREWRQVSLNAPLIWANTIDLGLLARKERTLKVNPRSKRWNLSDEIMRRTGSEATFYACGSVDWQKKRTRSFFVSWVSRYWKRIRVLDVELWNLPSEDEHDILPRALLCVQAPRLEVIFLWSRQLESMHGEEICFPLLDLDLPTSSMFHLRAINVSGQKGILRMDLFSILKNMPFLEVLKVYDCSLHYLGLNDYCGSRYLENKIVLSRLRVLILVNDLQTCLTILGKITPHPSCALQISASFNSNLASAINEADYATLMDVIQNYCGRFLEPCPIYTVSDLKLRLGEKVAMVLPSSKTGMPICIPSSLFNYVRSWDLSYITTLQFQFFGLSKQSSLIKNDFIAFFLACPSVQVLIADCQAVNLLYEIMTSKQLRTSGRCHFFPMLHTLKLHIWEISPRSFQVTSLGWILGFLDQRREMDMAIKLLDLSDCQERPDTSGGTGEYWDRYLKMNVRRNMIIHAAKTICPKDYCVRTCHSCGVASVLDAQSGDFKRMLRRTNAKKVLERLM